MATTPKKTKLPPADMSLIPADRVKALQLEAQKAVQAEKLRAAEEAFLEQEKERIQHLDDPVYEKRDILIDVAPHAARIVFDGKEYWQGQMYTVTAPVYNTLIEIVARTWKHEKEIGGANSNAYVQPRHNTLSGANF